MKSNRNLLGTCGIFGLALLALSFNFGGSAVRAEDESAAPNSLFAPISDMVQGLEARAAGLEATVMSFAGSFTSEHIATKELCVADDTGAKTCITKAQLDSLLKMQVQLGHAELGQAPPADQPTVAVITPPAAETADTDPSAPPAIGTVAAIPVEVTVTATVAAAGEAAEKDQDRIVTGSTGTATTEPATTEMHAEAPAPVADEKAAPDSVQ
jgi:hypothetical protein